MRITTRFVTRLLGVAAVLLAGFVLVAGPASAQDGDYTRVPPTNPQGPGNAPTPTVLSGPGVTMASPPAPPSGSMPVTGTDALTLAVVGGTALLIGSAFVLSTRRARLRTA